MSAIDPVDRAWHRLGMLVAAEYLDDLRLVRDEAMFLRGEVERLRKQCAWEGLHPNGCVCVYCAELYPLSKATP